MSLPRPRHMPPVGPGKVTAEEHVFALWRGVDLAPLEKEQLRARSLGQIVPKVLKELRIDNRRAEAEVVKVWNDLLDPLIVAHAQPTGMRKGTLFVTVDSSAWLHEIVGYRRKEILDRLRHSFGPDLITKISFRVG